MEKQSFLGSGMAFPVAINPGTGRFEMASEETSVRQSVYLILMTGLGERWMRPDFGSSILSYTFNDVSGALITMLRQHIQSAILEQEPRVSQVTVTVDDKQVRDALVVNIDYTLASTNKRENMVFPFYLQTEKEGRPDEAIPTQIL